MATQPGWELFRTLLAVVKEGSLSAAARTLDLTQPTVGRHIDALEKHLDVALFTRSERGGLVRVLEDEPVVTAQVWLVMHEALRTTRRVRLLFEHLAGAIARFLVSSPSGSRASATTRSRPSAGHPRGGGSRGGPSGGIR